MLPYIIIFWVFVVWVLLYSLLLKFFSYKISKLERKVKKLFMERSALIPAIFEVSKPYLNKHNDIFNEILKLRKREFAENEMRIFKIMQTKKLIHHEINFIFKVCNKHPRLIREWKFIYLRDLIIEKSAEIWENLEKYKVASEKLNTLITIKNFTIIGLLIPIKKKIKI